MSNTNVISNLKNALHYLKHFQRSDRSKADLANAKVVEASIEAAIAHYEAEISSQP